MLVYCFHIIFFNVRLVILIDKNSCFARPKIWPCSKQCWPPPGSAPGEDVPTMRSISISQILVVPWNFSVFFSAHVSSHALSRFHPRFTRFLPHLSHLPRSLSPTPWSRNHGIAPKVAAVAWYFFPKSCVECILRENLLILFCFSHIAWYSSE